MSSPEYEFQKAFPGWAQELAVQKVIAHQWARETGGLMRNDVCEEAEQIANALLTGERPRL